MNPIEARAALDSIDAAQRDLALKATYCPLWRHAAFAAVLTILVLGVGFGLAIQLPSVVLAMAGVAWLVTDDRRRYGVFVNGYRKGATLPVTLALVAVMVATMAAEIHARISGLSIVPKLGIGGIAFVAALGASIAWSRSYRRELMRGAA
ncbi:hypothetical protein CVO77_09585 [Sphingopyxis lindanitolerans]|uniref:Uncharacterized protein n=1 Tax=Sphingopyxis lindanitolerans TaxID=2054227 RepID=A0A2S8B8M3_9SPHN|nr:hypothetical protein [Sphingopyxis lindanitolerans]PQM28676.1 hypothetical protein CVO77_09585 [Sphingopyxis lindanitolerans]